jgi:hypothetical protein
VVIDEPDLTDQLIDGDNAALRELIDRHGATARTTRDRQLVAIAEARLAGDADRLDALVRDHLVDHPDGRLAAWLTRSTTHRRIR